MFSTGFNTIATKPVSGPLLREKDNHIRTRSHRGNAPYDFDTGISNKDYMAIYITKRPKFVAL